MKKGYVIGFLVDYGPPTALSIMWGLYAVYQQPEDVFWEVFAKNFVPAFFVLNWLAMRFYRTKRMVDRKEKSKVTAQKMDELKAQLDRIEQLLTEGNQTKKDQ